MMRTFGKLVNFFQELEKLVIEIWIFSCSKHSKGTASLRRQPHSTLFELLSVFLITVLVILIFLLLVAFCVDIIFMILSSVYTIIVE